MTKKTRSIAFQDAADSSPGSQESVTAIMKMISAAQNSAGEDLTDEFCIEILQECQDLLCERYNVYVTPSVDENCNRVYGGACFFVRMLSFIHDEISENLRDMECARILDRCIHHVMSHNSLTSNNLYWGKMM